MEGSLTLHNWQQLAMPSLGNISILFSLSLRSYTRILHNFDRWINCQRGVALRSTGKIAASSFSSFLNKTPVVVCLFF